MAKSVKRSKARKKKASPKDLSARKKAATVKGGVLTTSLSGGGVPGMVAGGGVPGRLGAVGPCFRPKGVIAPCD